MKRASRCTQVIDVPAATGGAFAQVMADARKHHAVAFIA